MNPKIFASISAVGILSFAFAAPTNPASPSNIEWVRYTDSAEGAFSIDVPVGWQIEGGMYRFG